MGGTSCILPGLKQGPQVSFDGVDSLKLPKTEQKGVLL